MLGHYLRFAAKAAAWVGCALLLPASWVPREDLIRTGLDGRGEHILAYALVSIAFVIGYPRWRWTVIFLGMSLYAGALEIGQMFFAGRQAAVADWMFSVLGNLLGGWCASVVFSRVVSHCTTTPASGEDDRVV